MHHLTFVPTPITDLKYYSKKMGVNLLCKRDDLFLEAGGGNKARMLQYILSEINSSNIDVLVTAGGPCSNFNRACALMCAKLRIKMHLIEYTDEPKEWESLNYYLCQLAGITTTRCDKSEVPQTIQDVLLQYKKNNVKTKFVYGGGKSLEGFFSYYDAVAELNKQCDRIDHVFLACGTGTTLTGICAGMQQYYPHAIIHAISTARRFEEEIIVLEEDMRILNNYLGSSYDFRNLDFSDSFLCGGYAKYNQELFHIVKECLSNEGMIVDPTYSGKALYGMIKTIESQIEKYSGKSILFWNTGGIINLLSTKYD